MTEVQVGRAGPAPDRPPELSDPVRAGPFAAAGRPFVIVADAEVAAHLADCLRDLLVDHIEAEPTVLLVARRGPDWMSHPWGVWRDGEPCETTLTDDYVMPYVLWEVVHLVLESAEPRVPVHAAAVARHGRALVLAGPSHAGKSTLAGWLTAHGWEFLTDEVALLERRPDGATTVHPFWRPIGVRRPGPLDGLLDLPAGDGEVLVPASALGALGTPSPLGAIVFPRYEPGSDAGVEQCPPAQAVRVLAEHVPSLGPDRNDVFRAVVAIVESVPAYSIAVDDLATATETLERIVAACP